MLDLISRWLGCVAVATGVVACGTDLADAGSGPSASDEGETSGAGADTDAPTGTSGDGSDDDSDAEPDPERGDCDEVLDCGPSGTCEYDVAGRAVCVCGEGQASIGYGCVPCEPVTNTADVDLPLVVVTGQILINGQSPPKNLYEYGDLYLRNPATDDEIFLGSTHEGEYSATALPGVYDVVFAKRSGGALVPGNHAGFVKRQIIDNDGPIAIEIDTTTVAGSIRFGDQTPPGNLYENGRVFLRNRATGDEVTLAETHEHDFVANVLPGAYSLHYEALAAKAVAPLNPDAFIANVDVPKLGEIVLEVDVEIPIVHIEGSITLAGAAPPANLYENGRITFIDQSSAAEISVAETHEGGYVVPLVRGTYDIVYERLAGDAVVPRNKRALLYRGVELDSSQTLDLDIPVMELSGSVTVNGQPPPSSASDDGVIRLHDVESNDVVVLGHTREGTFSRLVVPGIYQVHYAQTSAGAIMPANIDARLGEIVLNPNDPDIVIDVPVIDVSGAITVGGATPPTSEYSDGRLYLRNAHSGDSVLIGNTRLATFEARVVPGEYDVLYVVETTGDGVPLNGAAHLTTIDVAQMPEFDIDVPLVRMTGAITVDGESPPGDVQDHGVLFLQDVASADRIFLGDTRNGSYSTRVTAGQYLVGYRMSQSTGLVPQNADALLECIALTAP